VRIISRKIRDKVFDIADQGSVFGSAPKFLVPKTYWGSPPDDDNPHDRPDEWDRWVRRYVDLHADFLETLVGDDGKLLLFRGLVYDETRKIKSDSWTKPEKGKQCSLGYHWTYSTKANLRDAQACAGDKYNILITARVPFNDIDWTETLWRSVEGWYRTEKEIVVKAKCVDVVDVLPFCEYNRLPGPAPDFESWAYSVLGGNL